MRDMTTEIYDILLADTEIMKHVDKKDIKIMDYPNAQEILNTAIIIDPLISPNPSDYGDNENLTYEFLYQIDVFVKQNKGVSGRLLSERLILRIQKVLRSNGLLDTGTGVKPDWDKENRLHRQTKRFEGKIYKEEMEQL
ncbi:hypothetical protein JTF04_11465 [Mammaliicoccus vitulinus]|uniref:hypothetical protein n=1 Tax=Mammaliicoccus vitulinus TaxID=71237 RepID=UPI001950FA02|nr:hypothetical protein [Mammaliicoccus vitulinus]MBM6630304.1 hypothetical protein [Mammaliicoccus vitulinus]